MKTITKHLYFNTKLILLATSLLFNQAYANYSGDCRTLHVLVNGSVYRNFRVSSDSPVVNYGINKGCDKVDIDIGECTDYVFKQGEVINGPDIDIEFIDRRNGKPSTIRVQQNYCFFEAGNITVQPKKGIFTYKIYTGSFEYSRPGLVVITSIQTVH